MQWTLNSPGGAVVLDVSLDERGRLWYDVRRRGVMLLERSRLGVERQDASFHNGLVLVAEPMPEARDESYTAVHGKRSALHERSTAATLSVRGRNGAPLDIEFRVFDGAVAFRYRFPCSSGGHGGATVTRELTTFAFAAEGRAWMQPTSPSDGGGPAHENLYTNGVPIGTPTAARSYDLPATFEVNGQWLLVSEAGLDATYHGTRLDPSPVGREYGMLGPDPDEGLGHGDVLATSVLPWTLPWRFVAIADLAAELVESTVVRHLAEPARIADTSWIRPGRVSWSWWSENASPRDLGALRRFVDFAAEMGWEYSLVDANWTVHAEEEIRELVGYAAERDVRLFLWYNSAGLNNPSTEGPRDLMHLPEARRAELAKIAGWGIAGIKVDFFHSDKQDGIAHYLGILEDAAEAGVMVNFHGSTIPRGWERTWPHLMTLEAVRGAEWYLFGPSFAEEAVWHNTVLPFTRNVIGPMDYTPVTFGDALRPRLTTAAHELALAVVYESGLVHFADSPESYRRQPKGVREVLRAVPAAWDETVGLAGEPGDHIVLARRAGGTWWLAGINGLAPRTEAELGLGRLGPLRGTWRVVADGADRDEVVVSDTAAGEVFRVPAMSTGGGFVAHLLPG
ncbi:glycoside hydrolase family 97 catalytic domain-containing protein [Nonomuraea sp. NPDC046570]|uniref:glycoside hydrolase family 97 protein n=1 Tax=Nonomuraea sp. NPDC046570 TaxID=3155255 RepID=UPI0033EBBD48